MAARCVPSHACPPSTNNSSESFASTEAWPIRQVNVSQVESGSSDIDTPRDGFRFRVIHAMPPLANQFVCCRYLRSHHGAPREARIKHRSPVSGINDR
jgi:hypothetical protein